LQNKIAAMAQVAAEAGRSVCGEGVVSLSVGHSTYEGGASPGRMPDPNVLVAEADQRMYEMKARRKRPVPISLPEADVQELVH
jgi:hypothetical protein